MGNIQGPLKNVLKKIKSQHDLKAHLKEIFPLHEYKHITKSRLYKQTLTLFVDSAAALYEFNLKKEKILAKIRSEGIACQTLSFKIGA